MKTVEKITYNQTKPFILNIHYAHRMPCIQYAFGLFEDGELIGVVTYGQPASPWLCKGLAGEENRKNVIELNRLCLLPSKNGENNASFLVSHSLKKLPNKTFVVSYADCGMNHVGYVYQSCNFYFSGTTKPRTDKFSEGHSRHYSKEETRRIERSAKHRYIYIYMVGTKNMKKKMLRECKYDLSFNYPKGESKHYEIHV